MITLDTSQFGHYIVEDLDTDADFLVQIDYEYPSIAYTFGWEGLCRCGSSDGTVDCQCATVGEHISAAIEYLDDNIGKVVNDPGYFTDHIPF